MEAVLQDFIRALRNGGVRVSVGESLDAARTLQLVGYRDRERLKASLSAVLAKSRSEKDIFSTCFDRFFSAHRILPPSEGKAAAAPEALSPLSRSLLSGDDTALSMAMTEASGQTEVSGIRFFTQKGLYVQRILHGMGLEGLEQDISRLSRSHDPEQLAAAQDLEDGKEQLLETVRGFVEQQYTLFADSIPEQIVERYLRRVSLSNVDHQDMDRMRRLIRKMVKQLNDVHSRRRKRSRRGRLDFKASIRKNQAYQGLIFEPCWRTRKVDRPDVAVLCDVSRSVQPFSRFMLLFLHSLSEELARIRSFVFCSNLVEVSRLFEDQDPEVALSKIQEGSGLGLQLGATDYGRSFADFKEQALEGITHRTTLLILGDARNNYGNPRTDLVRLLRDRCKRILWLNPEPPAYWGVGDSDMRRYRPYCFMVKQCSTLTHLERVMGLLLAARR